VLALCLLLLGASCTSMRYSAEDPTTHRDAIRRLHARLAQNPSDAETLRELGVHHLYLREYGRGYDFLQQAFARGATDPKTLFFLGLASETVGQRAPALRLYEQYSQVPRTSPYRARMEGRYHHLVRQIATEEIRAIVQDTTGGVVPSSRVVAVFPLTYAGGDARYGALGRGLGEMLSVDLASIASLTVVERIRLQALLQELSLTEQGLVDPATAPRVGRLLGAGRIVTGSYNVLGGDQLRLDAALAQAGQPQDVQTPTASGALRELFQLEKALVFRIIEEMGVELTPEERSRIEQVPTQNLQAFLAFSRGLQEEDAGRFDAAAGQYRQASQLDPSFSAAAERATIAGSLSVESPSPQLPPMGPAAPTVDLLGSRLDQLNATIGAHLMPGQDQRNPQVDIVPPEGFTLPDPPPPPNAGGGN
jgi:TolB-like protein